MPLKTSKPKPHIEYVKQAIRGTMAYSDRTLDTVLFSKPHQAVAFVTKHHILRSIDTSPYPQDIQSQSKSHLRVPFPSPTPLPLTLYAV
jgi:hypothetical protein